MGNLASTPWDQGRSKEAEELEGQVTETSLRVLGRERPQTLIRIDNLASIYWDQGRQNEAEELDMPEMEIRHRLLT
jgi:hypothetical protein